MKGVWKKLIPQDEPNELPENETNIIEEIVELGKDLDFELSAEEVKESLEFDEKDFEDEDIHEIAQARAYKEAKEEEEIDDKNLAVLNMKQLNDIINISQSLSELVLDVDPDLERQSKVKSGLEDLFKTYKEEARQKSKKRQQKVSEFFKKAQAAENSVQDYELQLSSSDED
jgi:hypothetical protein